MYFSLNAQTLVLSEMSAHEFNDEQQFQLEKALNEQDDEYSELILHERIEEENLVSERVKREN